MQGPSRKKTLLVLLEPDGATRTRQFRISYFALRLLAMGLGLALICFVIALVVASRTSRDAGTASVLQVENDSLRKEFGRLSQIEVELEGLRDTNQQLLRLAGVVQADSTPLPKHNLNQANSLIEWELTRPAVAPRVGILSRGFLRSNQKIDHPGMDVAGPEGSLVVAAGGGVVVGSGWSEIYGNELLIDHGDGIETFYGHNKDLLVALGDSVLAGQPIARLGNTGRSSAPHLHFEVRVDGTPVDPAEFIREYQVENP